MNHQNYRSDIHLGEKYRDDQTGISGIATAVIFFQYGCERVDLETVLQGKIETYSFDAPRLTRVKDEKRVTTERTGGPAKESSALRRGGATR